jgi:hypothetical protein
MKNNIDKILRDIQISIDDIGDFLIITKVKDISDKGMDLKLLAFKIGRCRASIEIANKE